MVKTLTVDEMLGDDSQSFGTSATRVIVSLLCPSLDGVVSKAEESNQ